MSCSMCHQYGREAKNNVIKLIEKRINKETGKIDVKNVLEIIREFKN